MITAPQGAVFNPGLAYTGIEPVYARNHTLYLRSMR